MNGEYPDGGFYLLSIFLLFILILLERIDVSQQEDADDKEVALGLADMLCYFCAMAQAFLRDSECCV